MGKGCTGTGAFIGYHSYLGFEPPGLVSGIEGQTVSYSRYKTATFSLIPVMMAILSLIMGAKESLIGLISAQESLVGLILNKGGQTGYYSNYRADTLSYHRL